jgi:uncharacterized membrane protein
MTILQIVIIALVILLGFWLTFSYVPEPWKKVFLVILGIITLVWVAMVTGVLPGLNTRV